ncbi:MAG TPA: dihydroorotase [Flavobacteriales bacterium]|nr:dihydroorotase [Flavobacteriales bacterium]
MAALLLCNGKIVNEGSVKDGHILIEDGKISRILSSTEDLSVYSKHTERINIDNCHIFPGIIDDQVHFREPGLTHKADIYTESKAAVAGGVTSFMEMPNTIPNVFTQELLEEKFNIAKSCSLANYSFYLGASNSNLEEILKTNPKDVCGIKIFMGSSTGNMLVDDMIALDKIFANCNMLIATHCEDEETIQENLSIYQALYKQNIPVSEHPNIRSAEACYKSSSKAVALAKKHNTRLHVLHISTKNELDLFDGNMPLKDKRITSEACVHHLFFADSDYENKGNLIKWNPAIKTKADREAIRKGLLDNTIDIIATDHAPHTLVEKQQQYLKAPSGGPLLQHGFAAMLELYHEGILSLEVICRKMCHAPAVCFQIQDRGFIREGYWADLVVVDLNSPWKVSSSNLISKCQWSPFEKHSFQSKVRHTFVNGHLAYSNASKGVVLGIFDESTKGMRLLFDRPS